MTTILILLCVGAIVGISYFIFRKEGMSFSSIEKSVLSNVTTEEQKALEEFKAGKEELLAEYERLKLRVESLLSLKTKLPANDDSAVKATAAPQPTQSSPAQQSPAEQSSATVAPSSDVPVETHQDSQVSQ